MIDLHCHLDLYPNIMSFIKQVERKNKFTLVVTTSPRAWLATNKVFHDVKNIEIALGLHPELVFEKHKEVNLFFDCLNNCRFVGEVGIDKSNSISAKNMNLQTSFFKEVIQESNALGGRVISIHSRNAESIVLDIIEKESQKNTLILHWFTGSKNMLARAINANCLFSIGPGMLSSARGKRIAAQIPINRILPETDGPFVRIDGKMLMPWEAIKISSKIGDLFGLSENQILEQLNLNFINLMK